MQADTRIDLLGCPLDILSMDETVDLIDSRIHSRVFTQHVVVNVAKIVNMQKDSVLNESVRKCDIINVDGMGVVYGAKLLNCSIPERVTGIDLFYRLLHLSANRGYPVYFLGAKNEVVEEVKKRIQHLYPQLTVAGYSHGYFWDFEKDIVKEIRESGARLLFVAISSPKKENFINKWKESLGVDFVMGVGGTFDVVAGKVKRAPVWMQNVGLEWLFRLCQEPSRLGPRYFVTNSLFLKMIIYAKFKSILRH